MTNPIIWFRDLTIDQIPEVGGKNASLGEMIRSLSNTGVQVPDGFATTASIYREFLAQDNLAQRIYEQLDRLDIEDVEALARAGQTIRQQVLNTPLPETLESALREAYQHLEQDTGQPGVSVAVRSSATAEDLPTASFAGQQETFLNVSGIEHLLEAVKKVFASLFNDRAIAYRVQQGFAHDKVALSAGIQRMVRSDLACSGVMFTLDTESGFDQVVLINGAYGLGETVVQGQVNPDEFYVSKRLLDAKCPAVLSRNLGEKAIRMVYDEHQAVRTEPVADSLRHQFTLTDAELETLARQAMTIEAHYGRPMDIEWARDGVDQQLYIVQARPETVQSQRSQAGMVIERYELDARSAVLVQGHAIGERIGNGVARIIESPKQMDKLQAGEVLVADITDPDWEPIMKRASAIVTNRGGRTCHAAIIARELGIPAVVGCQDATDKIPDGAAVTVSCTEGATGIIYDSELPWHIEQTQLGELPELPVKLMLNLANPTMAFRQQQLPNAGVGLARLEFIINQMIGIHPRALLEFEQQPRDIQGEIESHIAAYRDRGSPRDFYVTRLVEGISTLAAAFWPKPVILRLSDFKSNEYANLIGGSSYEPHEENPMLGYRGAHRYIDAEFADCFALECEAIRYVRDTMQLTNLEVMIPFVRTLREAEQAIAMLARNGLKRGNNDLRLIMMCEIPSNALLADDFLQHFDGFSIGSNDLTQLTLGIDRDSSLVAAEFDERNPAVKQLLKMAITGCKQANKYVGICGQGPSDHPDLARWLMDQDIDSMSLNPDSVLKTWQMLGQAR